MKFKLNRIGWDIMKPKVVIIAISFFIFGVISFLKNRTMVETLTFVLIGIGFSLFYFFFNKNLNNRYKTKN